MILKAFAIRDAKAEAFGLPFFKLTPGEAERDFRTAVNDFSTKNNLYSKYPDDYDLYYLGEYDDTKGVFTSLDTPLHIIKAVQCVDPRNNNVTQLK